MKKFFVVMMFIFVSISTPVLANGIDNTGTITVDSNFTFDETVKRLEVLLDIKKIDVVAKVYHQNSAKVLGLKLNPTTLFIFGNPKLGTPLMQCDQRLGVELPMKALIWENDKGRVKLTYPDVKSIAKRYDLQNCDEAVNKVAKALDNIVNLVVIEDKK